MKAHLKAIWENEAYFTLALVTLVAFVIWVMELV